ncbi:MAG: IS110 family transposase, partial [Erysipelotrichaceae bacterium]
ESAVQLNSPITTIPGIGIYTGMCILSEIGDINCFDSSKKIVGYSGMDPATYQSGQYNAPTTALSKRGSRYLRKALYQCILPVCRFNPTFNTYYNLKRSQGKSHRCAQGHAIRKLIRVIFKLLSENCTFDAALLK